LKRYTIPQEWREYLPAGAEEWAGYWDEELESD
jgi:hypothetical protein